MQLILRPPASILSPASWPDVGSFGSSMEHSATGVEQVHCVGAGSLLLWLLLQARPNELAKQATQGLGHPLCSRRWSCTPTGAPDAYLSQISARPPPRT